MNYYASAAMRRPHVGRNAADYAPTFTRTVHVHCDRTVSIAHDFKCNTNICCSYGRMKSMNNTTICRRLVLSDKLSLGSLALLVSLYKGHTPRHFACARGSLSLSLVALFLSRTTPFSQARAPSLVLASLSRSLVHLSVHASLSRSASPISRSASPLSRPLVVRLGSAISPRLRFPLASSRRLASPSLA